MCLGCGDGFNTQRESSHQLDHLYRTYGYRTNQRKSYKFTEQLAKRVQELGAHPPKTFSGKQVVDVNTIDGLKMILEDGSWVLCRISGTEQLIRVYAESDNAETLQRLMKATETLLNQ